jgi:hypothetical protein
MQFIEWLTGLDPDGGSGALENLYLVPVIAFAAFLVLRMVRLGRSSGRRTSGRVRT